MRPLLYSIACFLTSFTALGCLRSPTLPLMRPDRYRTGGASHAELGSYGIKRTEGWQNPYEMKGRHVWKDAVVRIAASPEFNISSAHDLAATLAKPVEFVKDLGFGLQSEKQEEFKYVVVDLIAKDGKEKALVREINASSGLREILGENKQYRIVTACVYIFDHKLQKKFHGSFAIDIDPAPLKLDDLRNLEVPVKGKGEIKRDFTVKIADGTIVGYKYARLCWTSDGRVISLAEDRPLFMWRSDAPACPPGSKPCCPTTYPNEWK